MTEIFNFQRRFHNIVKDVPKTGALTILIYVLDSSERRCGHLGKTRIPVRKNVPMAEWSNATDLRSVSFGSAGSNPAGHISRKVYSKHTLLFAPLVAGSNPAERISSRSSVVERRICAFRSRWRHKPITHNNTD